MKKYVLLLISFLSLSSFSHLNPYYTPEGSNLSEKEITDGLKEALRVGTNAAVATLNKKDGYFLDQAVKILLPPEARVVFENADKLSKYIPGGSEAFANARKDVVLKINRAAENAAIEAKPIFVNAVTSMTIKDGLSILQSKDTAATSYLRKTTYPGLYKLFEPKIGTSLNKNIISGVSAQSAYASLVNTYNTAAKAYNAVSVFTGQKRLDEIKNSSLSSYTTHMALKGLFIKVAEKEKAIRKNPQEQVTDILKKVFSGIKL